ncbi:MAG: ABC transporter permease [Clostridia bacterium]|nr:ABC transporter permease [Clostridia bacterium]
MERNFERYCFGKRQKSMLAVDFRRMFTAPLFYIIAGVCLVIPILILVMTTMMDGTVSVNPQTGAETIMEGFDNVWQAIATTSDASGSVDMTLTGMCNINMVYFIIAVLVGVFVSEEFKSGYAKNLFTVRAKKSDYIISKTLVCFVSGVVMILLFFIGTVIGGAISALPFDLGAAGVGGLVMCMLAKMLLVAVFVAIDLVISVAAKQRTWLSILGSLGAGMLLFTMIPMLTPLDAGIMNVILCLAGGALFAAGLGAVGHLVLRKTSLV